MVGILKVSQNLYQNVYQFVPIQNFTDGSDIDWNKSVADIDKQLYTKYDLTAEEIAFIEESAKMIAAANGVSIEEARLIHREMWSCVHGIAVMLATSFLPLEESLISDIISDVYRGVLARHMPEN